LILNAPTVGVDIGAKYDIHLLLKKYASEGMSIIVVSDDAAEVIVTCGRVLVMKNGRITGEKFTENLDSKVLASEIISYK
jgi:simple sugar transport system ATP-binding protein